LVGAPGKVVDSVSAGSAYVFNTATVPVLLVQTLNKPTPAADDQFGCSVAVQGSVAVVGEVNDDAGALDAGSAYIFDAVKGALLRAINDPAPAAEYFFGAAVATSATTIVVGSPGLDGPTVDRGAAYLLDARNLPWHNSPKPLDVNNDMHIVAGDTLAIINYINARLATAVPADAK